MSTAARIDELRKKFEENPRRYFAPLANEFRKTGELAQAIALCREHLPKQPGHMSGYIVFGQALYESGDLAEARSVFEQALALDPENLIALRHLGDIARASGDAQAARRWYERVLDADPRNDDIAAQLATLATGLTPASVPVVPSTVNPFARPMETPPLSMSAIGLSAMPTPDSVMRAVDFDEINARVIHRTPIDLDAIDANVSTPVEATADVADVVADEHAEVVVDEQADAVAHDVVIEPTVAAIDDGDPFDFDDVASANTSIVDAPVDVGEDALPTPLADVEATSFEEGLIAPEWPDTSDLVARVVTPRSFTPRHTTPLSLEATTDAVSAFGREASDPVQETLAAADAVESLVEPAYHNAFDDTLTEASSGSATDATSSDDAEIEVTYVESADDHEIISMAPEHELIELSFDDDAVAVEEVALDAVALDAVVEDSESLDFETIESSYATPAASAAAVTPVMPAYVDAIVESAAESHVEFEAASAEPERANADVELPWIGAAEHPPVIVDEFAASQPGLEELAEAFAADARAAGDDDIVTVAALDEVAEREAEPVVEELVVDDQLEDRVADDYVADDHVAEEHAAYKQSSESPAFVTETMGELLVSQGFVSRAADVYEELVRRRPYDQVLSSRLLELRAMLSAESEANAAADSDVAAPAAPVNTPPWSVSGVHPVMPTPSYGTPAFGTPSHATPIIPLSAMSEPAWVTPPRVTPYAQPAFRDAAMTQRLAGEWFATVAARRVPRRTPTQAVPAVAAATEGLSSLFGAETSVNDDTAARALADAFAPVSAADLDSGATLDFEFARSTPAFTPAVATPSAPVPTPPSGGSGNAGFSFDKFFPDPAMRRGTPTAPSPALPEAPVTDDLAQFSAWLKGLGNT